MIKEYTIVGIDPGMTVGIAILDLKGKLIRLHSSKEMSINSIIEFTLSFGHPVIVATDVSTVPQTVEKICSSLGAKLYVPNNPIPIKEKNEIAKEHPIIKNAHERDSLSAAVKSFQHYNNKFENIDSRLKEMHKEEHADNVKALVIKGYTVADALEELTKTIEPVKKLERAITDVKKEKDETTHEITLLNERIKSQLSYIRELENELLEIKRKLSFLEMKIDEWDDEAEIKAKTTRLVKSKSNLVKKLQRQVMKLKNENKALIEKINELNEIRKLQLQEKILVCKNLDQFTKSAINELESQFKIKPNEILYIKDCSGGGASSASMLCEKKVKAILYGGEMSHTAKEALMNCGIAMIDSNDIDINLQEDYGIVDKKSFDEAYRSWEKLHKNDLDKKKLEWLNSLIKDYKHERKKRYNKK